MQKCNSCADITTISAVAGAYSNVTVDAATGHATPERRPDRLRKSDSGGIILMRALRGE
jgi:hypothetical protein